MSIGFCTHAGRVRTSNEDYLLVDEEIGLVLVADGVGGHQAGEVASQLAAQTIHRVIKQRLIQDQKVDLSALIHEAIGQAHDEIQKSAADNLEHNGMGSTVVLGLCRNEQLFIGHVGDSRAYLIHRRKIRQLTSDHSLVATLVKIGDISEKEARDHSMRHVITQCLGCEKYSGPDIHPVNWQPEDILLLCSDGLSDLLTDQCIRKTVQKSRRDLQACADKLVDIANQKGGFDNISVILLDFGTRY